jgi:hypothetical protein
LTTTHLGKPFTAIRCQLTTLKFEILSVSGGDLLPPHMKLLVRPVRKLIAAGQDTVGELIPVFLRELSPSIYE